VVHSHVALWPFGWFGGAILIGVILAVVLLAVWRYRKTERLGDGLTTNERRTLEEPERELLGMVRQHGAPIPQSWIVEEAPGGFDRVAAILHELEAKGLIRRVWDPAANELMVSA